MVKATVVIPNYNGMKFLPKCIEALRRQTVSCFDILVVENGSSDGSAEWLEAHQVPMLKEEENLGFAGGVNAGIRACSAPYVILLNNDTEVFPDFVEELIRALEAHTRLFAVSARMLQTDDRSRMDDAGDGISLFGWAWQRGFSTKRTLLISKTLISAGVQISMAGSSGMRHRRRSFISEAGPADPGTMSSRCACQRGIISG